MKCRTALAAVAVTAGTLAVAPTVHAQEGCPIGQYLTETGRDARLDDVRCLQAALHANGVDAGPVDGWFGPITRGAVVAFQTANGLTVDGEVGAQTAGQLGLWSPAPRAAARPQGDSPEQQQANTARADSGGGTVWDRLAQCESGGNWSINTGNGYYGGLQFGLTAWRATGGSGLPSDASRAEQIARAETLLDMSGWGAWPACARRLGLR